MIAQGFEAGGHVRGTSPLADLVAEVVARLDVPVLAAGGIVDGKGLAAALRRGAQGAVIGTGFLATQESFAHDYHKTRLVESKSGDTVHTEAFHINWPKGAAVRVLPEQRDARRTRRSVRRSSTHHRRAERTADLPIQHRLAIAQHERRLRGHGALRR